MGKISLDLSSIKAAGVYTIEIDNSQRTSITTNAVRLCVGFSNKGPFNRPVFLQRDTDRTSIFGDIDTKLEHKGCFFNRALRTLISNGPVLALNLLNVDDSYTGPDQVNYAAMSLNAGKANPKVEKMEKYAEYDYLADSLDFKLYETTTGDNIPFVGTTPFASLYNRARFWNADKDLLSAAAAKGLGTIDYTTGSGSYEHGNLLNFANVGTEEISVLVYKAENINGYDITAESWYGGASNIPFGWIRPGDYISDYFITVVCVKGNWTNYPVLSTDPLWSAYFDKKGVIKNKISNFVGTDGVTLLGSWTGIIIPNFIDKQGTNLSIERKINAVTEKTGLLMSFNEDAAHVLNFDYSGIDAESDDPTYGAWGYDIDGDNEISSEDGESGSETYIVDMVGHEVFKGTDTDEKTLYYEYLKNDDKVFYTQYNDNGTGVLGTDWTAQNIVNPNVFANTEFLFLVKPDARPAKVETQVWYFKDDQSNSITGTAYDHNIILTTKQLTITTETVETQQVKVAYIKDPVIKAKLAAAAVESQWFPSGAQNTVGSVHVISDSTGKTEYKLTEANNFARIPFDTKAFASGVYLPMDFINTSIKEEDGLKASVNNLKNLINNTYYILSATGRMAKKTISDSVINIRYYNYGNVKDQEITNGAKNNVQLSFVVNGETYFINISVDVDEHGIITGVTPGLATATAGTRTFLDFNLLTQHEIDNITNGDDGIFGVNMSVNGNVAYDDATVGYVMKPTEDSEVVDETVVGINFLSYNYLFDQEAEDAETNVAKKCLANIKNVYYFNDKSLWADAMPVSSEAKNMFIITKAEDWTDDNIKVGDFVRNITYFNNIGETMQYKLIPGITRVVKKQFVIVNNGIVTWKGKQYEYAGADRIDYAKNGSKGFYLFTTTDPVLIEKGTTDDTGTYNFITRQLPLSDDVISHSLRFIPMKGLKLSSRHRPGYDKDGGISIEGGIEKIYSVLEDQGIHRGLCNEAMVDYRYIIDSFSYGLRESLGGKVYLSRLAQDRGKCTALLNMPSAKQFAVSTDPYFCDSYIPGTGVRPGLNTKYIPEGGNTEMGSPNVFGLPNEDDGAKYAAAFFPNLIYSENGRTISVPPAADVANVFYRKFTGVNDPYAICANQNGIINNRYVTGVEFDADTQDREYLEPMGVNTIIRDRGQIMIYGNQTCFQAIKSDFNKLHVRENLNTMEIECNAILKQYNFLYNTPATRAAIVQMLTPVLSTMQTSGALAAYEIICDETNNTPEIIEGDYGIVDIAVWFNHGMEKIVQRITVNRYSSMSE